MRLPLLALTLFASIPAASFAAPPTTVRVEVTESNGGSQVDVNVPLAVAETALALAPIDDLRGTTLRVNDRDITVAQLRTLWKELKRSGDGDVVSVKDAEDHVRISMKGGMALVRVEGRDGATVRVDVPHAVVDALLSGKDERLDFSAALDALRRFGPGEIVRVTDGAERIVVRLE